MIPYAYRPSVGLVFFSVVLAACLAFFAWGLKTPPLDMAWETMIDLEAGTRGHLTNAEYRALRANLRRHDGLAQTGIISEHDAGRIHKKYAYVVRRRRKDPGRIVVGHEGPKSASKLQVRGRVNGVEVKGHATKSEPFIWDLPDDGPFPQLVELRFPKKKKRDAVLVEVVEKP